MHKEKRQSIEITPEKVQTLGLIFKADITMFKELKETMSQELRRLWEQCLNKQILIKIETIKKENRNQSIVEKYNN